MSRRIYFDKVMYNQFCLFGLLHLYLKLKQISLSKLVNNLQKHIGYTISMQVFFSKGNNAIVKLKWKSIITYIMVCMISCKSYNSNRLTFLGQVFKLTDNRLCLSCFSALALFTSNVHLFTRQGILNIIICVFLH